MATSERRLRPGILRMFGATIGAGALTVLLPFGGLAPAAADYAPFIIANIASGPPRTEITFGNDPTGPCQRRNQDGSLTSDGVVEWAFGTVVGNPDIGGVVELDEVLVSGLVETPHGGCSVTVTVPDGTPPGVYALTGRCLVSDVAIDTTTTTPTTTTPTTTTPTTTTPSTNTAAVATAGTDPRAPLFDYYPARFTVTQVPATVSTTSAPSTTPAAAAPASVVEGAATFTC